MKELYADIIVNISHEKVDKAFQYRIPQEMVDVVETGTCVQVPFGVSNKLIKGYVVNVSGSGWKQCRERIEALPRQEHRQSEPPNNIGIHLSSYEPRCRKA